MRRAGIGRSALIGLIILILVLAAVGVMFLTQKPQPTPPPPPPPSTVQNQTPPPPPPPPAVHKVAVVFDVGGRGDLSFNDLAYMGAERAKSELGVEVEYVTPASMADFVPVLEGLASSGDYDVIIGIGFLLTDAINNVSQEYPNQNFAIIDSVVDQPNVASYVFREQECGALVGAIATVIAHDTGNDKIAALMGMDIPPLWRFHIGYLYGAKWMAQQLGTDVDVLYVYTGTFTDPATGKDATLQLIDQGANVIYGLAGATHIGAFEAVKERAQQGETVFAIGQDAPQEWYDPDHIFVSGRKKVDVAVYDAIEMAVSGNFQGGIHSLGLAEDGVGISTLDEVQAFAQFAADAGQLPSGWTPESVRQRVAELRDQYISQDAWNLISQLENQIKSGQITFVNPADHTQYEQVIQALEAGDLSAALAGG